jgi:nucleoside-triphosphatase THEP1
LSTVKNASSPGNNVLPAGFYRIVALWAACEGFLGGILHGMKLPVTGLVVGGFAVVCICLIGRMAPARGAILKATLAVAVIKMMLSPYSPPAAYLAVFFQGLLGELLFSTKKYYRLSCLLLGMLALFESGIQRIIVLTIIYGNDFWKTVNDFVENISGNANVNYSFYFAGGYVILHVIAGAGIGWYAGLLPEKIKKWNVQRSLRKSPFDEKNFSKYNISSLQPAQKRKKISGLFITWILLLLIYIHAMWKPEQALIPKNDILHLLIRAALILLTWHFLLSPLLLSLLKSWLNKQSNRNAAFVKEVMHLLPAMKNLLISSWAASGKKFPFSLPFFFRMTMLNTIYNAQKIYVITGAVQTGKTTKLLQWSEKRNDVFGVLSPVVDGKRNFMDVKTRQVFPMEAMPGETETIAVGKFIFSTAAFRRADEIMQQSLAEKSGWIVLDEIGPLELQDKGFAPVAEKMVTNTNEDLKCIWVIRESLAEKALLHFLQ